MSGDLGITVLVENTVQRAGLRAEHGLSLWIESAGRSMLFDVGQTSGVLAANARRLGIDLTQAEAVVLSHGHYDHTGSLARVVRDAPQARVYAHPAVWRPRYHVVAGQARPVGMRSADRRALQAVVERGAFHPVEGPTEILPGVVATGPIARLDCGGQRGEGFAWDRQGRQPDLIPDDEALCLSTDRGVVVILGCAHAGVINSLRTVQGLYGSEPLHAVLGGMHLRNVDRDEVARTVRALSSLTVDWVAPGHCTGPLGWCACYRVWGDRCRPCSVGERWTLRAGGATERPLVRG